jgi:3-dehydroquinate synthase
VRQVTVRLGRASYRILIGAGSVASVGRFMAESPRPGVVAVVADRRVASIWEDHVRTALADVPGPIEWILVPQGERAKSLRVFARVLDGLAGMRMGRDGTVIALGGGATGDLAGFAAACYVRGVALMQVPTSLLAQVDASVGGKTAVNIPAGKNLVGAFHQPRLVACDPTLLRTLPRREVRSGLAEAIKHGLIGDEGYLRIVELRIPAALKSDPEALEEIVAGSCRVKAAVVSADERESGIRAILNFGHTIGHGLERAAGYRGMRHGEAVAVGMVGASVIAERLGLCPPGVRERLESMLAAARLPRRAERLDPETVLGAMEVDKKRTAAGLRFVLPTAVGRVAIRDDVPRQLVAEVVRDLTRGVDTAAP